MLNFFPSPIECLIYRANQKPSEENKELDKKEEESEGKENESSRKILNEMSNTSNIINSPHKDLINNYSKIEKNGVRELKYNQENDESGNKKEKEIELRNYENFKKV